MLIVLADDHKLLRELVASALRQLGPEVGETEVIEATDHGELMRLSSHEPKPDLVITDFAMPGSSGLDGVKEIISAFNGTPVILMSGTIDGATALEALKAGASGYIPKTVSITSFIDAARIVMNGERYIHPSALDMVLGDRTGQILTASGLNHAAADLRFSQREMDVARLMIDGKTNKEIARELQLHEMTIKTHLRSIFRRVGAATRTEAAKLLSDRMKENTI